MDGMPSEPMLNSLKPEELLSAGVDLSSQFQTAIAKRWPTNPDEQPDEMAMWNFDDQLREARHAPQIRITVDWSMLPNDQGVRVGIMRKMKAMAERSKQKMAIRGTHDEYRQAAQIEANVLSSGVKWEYTDQVTQV